MTKVKFYGGAYDGLSFEASNDGNGLTSVAELPICQSVLHALAGKITKKIAPVQQVCIYAGLYQDGEMKYVHSRNREATPDELPGLNSWVRYVIQCEAKRKK